MILIGQYDSPFVRRVGIALTLYRLPFAHQPWSAFGDADKIRPYNPLVRVPTLVLDDRDVLIESHVILDHLDSLAPPELAMCPPSGHARRSTLRVAALAMGAADLAVSLFYELRLHPEPSGTFVHRRRSQIQGALASLESDLVGGKGDAWFGSRVSHADVAAAVAIRFIREAHPGLFDADALPRLAEHAERLESLEAFRIISQPFIPPA